ncbi:GlsB/YeaQ/YmgE family stress response membrane protein [Taibaiella sp. KBW10]|uniref:GlsB/YeaQ/YmgE family stress response membrane protein n=1 Tax=Taibaiella sp. KBW10 TaxID=2153357 RepID=UPI000F595C62|nr:GlsB/YeaQ/YmgE family stress response membrane protein [Taibaiella sp. KBW10]RQO30523.1 GlsB/YeaQ/YmgE family stress response membrane protein [Taibaiella sp. KBW10]
MSNIIFWIVFGGIAGALAKFIMPGKNEPQGCIITIILGIVGALVGGFIGDVLWSSTGVTGFNLRSFALAVGGALVVLFIYGKIAGKK